MTLEGPQFIGLTDAEVRQRRAEGRANPQVVTILCDTGFRYLSTLYNPEWLSAKGLPVFGWLTRADYA